MQGGKAIRPPLCCFSVDHDSGVRAMTDEEFRKHLEWAAALVATWPEWKRNILKHSLSPTVSVPRKPVNNGQHECY